MCVRVCMVFDVSLSPCVSGGCGLKLVQTQDWKAVLELEDLDIRYVGLRVGGERGRVYLDAVLDNSCLNACTC